jgi:adenylylsulfate kinase
MKNPNVVPHNHAIKLADRIQKNDHKPLLIWLTGLSGSGKSTIASELERQLYQTGAATYILDGDNIRSGLNSDLDFSEQSRVENIRRIGEVAKLFIDAGVVVITAFISPFEKERDWVKNLVGDEQCFQVFVDCPLEVCEARDVKGLYQKARKGEIKNFTGIDSPFEIPQSPNLVVNTSVDNLESVVTDIYNIVAIKIF